MRPVSIVEQSLVRDVKESNLLWKKGLMMNDIPLNGSFPCPKCGWATYGHACTHCNGEYDKQMQVVWDKIKFPKKYLVAWYNGFAYMNFQIVEAISEADASMKYREKYVPLIGFGSVISEIIDGKVTVPVEYFVS